MSDIFVRFVLGLTAYVKELWSAVVDFFAMAKFPFWLALLVAVGLVFLLLYAPQNASEPL